MRLLQQSSLFCGTETKECLGIPWLPLVTSETDQCQQAKNAVSLSGNA